MKKAKFILLALVGLFTFFFSNDFGLIDVEKTSIITAIAIDKENDEYLVTAQIAVPEATDTNAENQKSEISAKGKTIGEALKNTGDVSGWFPKLAFCNLIILGESLKDTNVISVLDYFAKTLRVQDSATVVLADGKAQELLKNATPLDNISSFAIQKILLKNPGFDREVCPIDIKTFCSQHYSRTASSFMPIVKLIKADASGGGASGGQSGAGSLEQSGSSSGSSGGQTSGNTTKNENLFDARTTALFKDGKKVGELSPELTLIFNALNGSIGDTTLAVDNVEYQGKPCNFLLTVQRNSNNINVKPLGKQILVDITAKFYCKISDVNSGNTEFTLSQNIPLPNSVVTKTRSMLENNIYAFMDKCVNTGCDLIKIKEKLYRYHNEQYSNYKDDYLSNLIVNVNVEVVGQK